MPKKKPAKKPKTHISFRLAPAELEPLDADRKALPGVPVARNTYAKHAVKMYPALRKQLEQLRKLEETVRKGLTSDDSWIDSVAADKLLKEAGL